MANPRDKQKHERHDINYRGFASVTALFKVVTDSLGAFLNFVPPLNAAITGVVSLLELGEAMFMSEESRKRRAVKAVTAAIGVGLMVASAILIFNPATAPIAATLIVASIATATIKEGYFWYKRHQDYNHSVEKLNQLNLQRRSLKDPEKIDAINAEIAAVTNHLNHCRTRIDEHRTSFIYNALSLVGAVLLTVAAFAVVGAIVSNPIGLGIAGVAMLGIATAFAISRRLQSRHKSPDVMPLPVNIPSPTVQSEITHGERTSQIVNDLVDHMEPSARISSEHFLQSDIEHLKKENDINTLNMPTVENDSLSSAEYEKQNNEEEGEGEGKSSSNPSVNH